MERIERAGEHSDPFVKNAYAQEPIIALIDTQLLEQWPVAE